MENLLGIKRTKGIQRSKKPMLINDLKLIIDVIDKEKSKNLKKLRDRTLLLLGFAGGFRRSELVPTDVEDLEFVNEG